MRKGFFSINTPEYCALARRWYRGEKVEYPNPLPAHYLKIKIKKKLATSNAKS